jgi:hypothetical protein
LALTLYLLFVEELLVKQPVESPSPQYTSNPSSPWTHPSSPQVEASTSSGIQLSPTQAEIPVLSGMDPSSPQPEASNLPGTPPTSPQLETSALPGTPQAPPQLITQELPLGLEEIPQEARNEVSVGHPILLLSFNKSSLIRQNFQDQVALPSSFSFTVDDLATEKGDEGSSSQDLSKENQAKLREILSLLQRDIQDQVRDVDLLEEVLKSINQELPDDIKASLEPISQLDNHFAAVRRALKNPSSRLALEQKRAKAKQFVKESQAQIQSNKELLAKLQPALELNIARKAALEVELKNLTAEIEADKKKIAELPGLTEKIQKEASAVLIESNQLKTKLFALSNTQEADQKLLENISKMISDASSVISKYLNI